ncbi:LacI family DNA-binding transcriptional regulator [Sphingobium sp. 3R8]|uniref:LacI family DNA-binding transcriptional regulator n=1 Tax=Sphingobium sp. 3R8 TaxID=2874921 RepID=UPI001CC924EA|nr:LacI family DNA-binding transcriptional regulator [Sphingobium sp. 3R8]MBZ9650304.1 LacI family DNA-binding transcriptional regulator [Sphingobium sp. 3R8]
MLNQSGNIPPMPPSQRATIGDVAEMAGVSTKSVSRVINNERHVSPFLRRKVEAAIAALNYVPDMAARSLASTRSFTIAVLFDNPSPNYITKIQTGAYRACMENGYHLRVDHVDTNASREACEARLMAVLRNARTDGFILTPPLCDIPLILDFLEGAGARYSRIAPVFDPERSRGVIMDDYCAAADVAELFWNLGHRRIAILNGPANHGVAPRRRQGFIDKLTQLGLREDILEAQGNFLFEDGIAATRQLLSVDSGITAIFATNDDSAAGAMAACAEAGLSVPGDISVCGFDDGWIARSVWPYLSTVHQPIEEMAYYAAKMLIENDGKSAELMILPYYLVHRDSITIPRRSLNRV